MFTSTALAQDILDSAAKAAEAGPDSLAAALDQLQAPIYVTDANGVITYFNPACIGFTGRTPKVGKDRWCVTWKLYTDAGEPLPHDVCPMAVSIRERRPIRGVTAVAQRPDGTRVNFFPLPTPIVSGDGRFLGAVNMLIDVTELRQLPELRSQARRARRLSKDVSDSRTAANLKRMAEELEAKAESLEAASPYVRL